MKNKSIKNRSSILITCISCIVLLLTMCYFGVSNSKGTYSTTTYECSRGTLYYSESLGKNICGLATYNSSTDSCVTYTDDSLDATDKGQAGWECSLSGGTYTCLSSNLSLCTISATEVNSTTYYAYFINDSSTYSTKSCSTTGSQCQITTPSAPSKSGYTFKGWGTTSGCTSGSIEAEKNIYIDSDKTYYACYTANENTYTYKFMNGSSLYDTKECTITGAGSNCAITTPSAPSKSGYTFKGWGTTSGCTSGSIAANTGIYIDSDKTYYACYTANENTYTYKFMNGSSLYDTKECTITGAGSNCAITTPSAPSKSGYTFKNWGTTSGCTSGTIAANTGIYIDSDKTYYACYTAIDADYGCYRCFVEDNINGTVPDAYKWSYTDDLACNSVAGIDCDNITVSCYRDSSITSEAACSVGGGTTDDGSNIPTPEPGTDDKADDPSSEEIPDSVITPDEDEPSGSNNVAENPQTGSVAIFIVWVIALGTICYAFWYFRSLKKVK